MSDKSELKAELERKKQRLAQIREEKKRKEEERKKKEVRMLVKFYSLENYFLINFIVDSTLSDSFQCNQRYCIWKQKSHQCYFVCIVSRKKNMVSNCSISG